MFRGEGEEVFPQWLKVWNHSKETWKAITGLCYLDENGRYQDNGIARVMNFSQLVSPEKSCFFNWSKPFVQLETTRGCFNTCAFCVSGGEKPVRTIPLEAIRALRTCAYSTVLLITTTNGLKNYWTYSGNIRTSVFIWRFIRLSFPKN